MRLQADQSVKDLHAGVFQIARPADVRRLIEARFQLHHGGDFLVRRGAIRDGTISECSLVR
jgi:hypothetical protein